MPCASSAWMPWPPAPDGSGHHEFQSTPPAGIHRTRRALRRGPGRQHLGPGADAVALRSLHQDRTSHGQWLARHVRARPADGPGIAQHPAGSEQPAGLQEPGCRSRGIRHRPPDHTRSGQGHADRRLARPAGGPARRTGTSAGQGAGAGEDQRAGCRSGPQFGGNAGMAQTSRRAAATGQELAGTFNADAHTGKQGSRSRSLDRHRSGVAGVVGRRGAGLGRAAHTSTRDRR